MLEYFLLLVILIVCQGFPQPGKGPQRPVAQVQKQQILLQPNQQQYQQLIGGNFDYGVPIQEAQFPIFNHFNQETFPRVAPHLLPLYPTGPVYDQSFLLHPSGPPGNFLVPQPQPGPNLIFRGQPQRPVFVAGYPRPAHIPPIEKDAEEIPTNGPKRPSHGSRRRPEKLETFTESNSPKKQENEADVLAAADKIPLQVSDLKPGQRFFILNGQPLFSDYSESIYGDDSTRPHFSYAEPQENHDRRQVDPNAEQQARFNNLNDFFVETLNFFKQEVPVQQPQHLPIQAKSKDDGINELLHRDYYYLENKNPPPTALADDKIEEHVKDIHRSVAEIESENRLPEDLLFYHLNYNGFTDNNSAQPDSNDDNDAVVIEARNQTRHSSDGRTDDDESIPKRDVEPTISQAQPGAIALAGPGGVAAAAPRGTAFVGKGGLAIATPQATAVAGPKREETNQKKPKTKTNNS